MSQLAVEDVEVTRKRITEARDTGRRFFELLGYLDDDYKRTNARAHVEQAIAWTEQMLEDLG